MARRGGSLLREPPLLEREAELARLGALLDDARSGSGNVAVIEGPPGIGKTRILTETCALAVTRQMAVLTARGGPLERDFPFSIVRQLFQPALHGSGARVRESLLEGAASLAQPIVDTTSSEIDPTSAVDRSFSVVHGLYWLASNLAERAPILLAVDDLHWADLASLRFLEYVLHRIRELPIAILGTLRPTEPEARDEVITRIATDPSTIVLRPSVLSETATSALLFSVLEREVAVEFARACHQATSGNPFLLGHLIGTLHEQGIPPTAAEAGRVAHVAPEALSRIMLVRLNAMGNSALRLARAVAVLGNDADMRHASALAGLDDDIALDVSDTLAAADILRRQRPLEFVHPVVREAIYSDIPRQERADTHARAATILHEARLDPDRIAMHLVATEAMGRDWVASTLAKAGTEALARGAPDEAVNFFQRALAESLQARDRAVILRLLGRAKVRLGDASGIEHLRDALDISPEVARELGHALLLFAREPDEVLEVFDSALARLEDEDSELRLHLETDAISTARLWPSTYPLAGPRLARVSSKVSGETPGERLILASLALHQVLEGGSAKETADLAARALEGGLLQEQGVGASTFYDALYAAIMAEDFDLGSRFCREALAEAGAQGSLIGFAAASAFSADLGWRRGFLLDGEAHGYRALEVALSIGSPIPISLALSRLVEVLIDRGEIDNAREAFSRHMAEDIPRSRAGNSLLFSRGRLHLALGEEERGLSDLLEVSRREKLFGGHNVRLPYRSMAAIVLAQRGHVDESRELADEELELAREWGAPRAIGVALHGRGLVETGEKRVEYFREAIASLEHSQALLEHGRACVELGVELHRLGYKQEAQDRLRRGLDIAHRCAATPLVDQAYKELVATGARPRRPARTGVEALTPSERRIVAMAAEGATNRGIAQSLFLSLKTVEMHLSNAYRKLGIHSRAELPQTLASESEQESSGHT